MQLESHDLFAKAKKCFFKHKSIDYLNMVISKNQIAMDSKKVFEVTEWPEPTKVK